MDIYTCDNCSFQFPNNEDFCPNCGIPVLKIELPNSDYYICPICDAKNPIGERKCLYCCSLL